MNLFTNRTKYKAPAYIERLKVGKLPADKDWQGVENPLTVYDRIEATEAKYEYLDLYDHFDKISENGKHSLGASLFEWIVNRVIPHYDK